MVKLILLVGASLLIFAPQASMAMAGPPLITDDPQTPGRNNWEINIALTTEMNQEQVRLESPIADINYGLGEQIQLKYEIPWVYTGQNGEKLQSGFDQSIGGVKWRFLDKDKVGFSASTYPQMTFSAPVSSQLKNPALVDEDNQTLIPIEFEEYAGRFEFNEEVGRLFRTSNNNQWVVGMSLGYIIRDGFTALSEIHSIAANELNDFESVFNIGGAIDLSKKTGVLVSMGRSLRTMDGEPATFHGYLGLQIKL